VRLGEVTLLIDHRGDAWVALLELEPSATTLQPLALPSEATDIPLQLIRVSGRQYLCTWQRNAPDSDWLKQFVKAAMPATDRLSSRPSTKRY
jgi:hypothetical protein